MDIAGVISRYRDLVGSVCNVIKSSVTMVSFTTLHSSIYSVVKSANGTTTNSVVIAN